MKGQAKPRKSKDFLGPENHRFSRKEEEKKSSKDKKIKLNYMTWAVPVAALIIIFLGYLLFHVIKPAPVENQELSASSLNYINYEIQNESLLKSKCAYVRIGHCDDIGLGQFGKTCYFRDVNLLYNSSLSSLSGILCTAYEDNKSIGISNFAIKSTKPKVSSLVFNVDIRKETSLVVCCKEESSTAEAICMPEIKINAIC